jgi:hypothetical protein
VRSVMRGVVSMAMPAILVGAFFMLAGTAWGAPTGISVSPHHLVLAADGPPGKATISWTTPATHHEVWASVNGGPRNLVARSATAGRHSKRVEWIQPGYTVFSLYAGRTQKPGNHTPSGRFLGYTSVTTQAPPASTFGIAYWPALETNASTLGRRWPLLSQTVARDLDLLASMGIGVVRLNIWPLGNPFTNDPGVWTITPGPGGDVVDREVLARQAYHLVRLIKLCRDRGLKVTITFSNNYLRRGPRSADRQYLWEWAYPPEDGGWQSFVDDAISWIDGYVKRIESSPEPGVRSTVVAYDLQNEVAPPVFPYLRHVYDHSAIPRGKRGVSLLSVRDHASRLKEAMGNRHLDYVEYHSYPGGINPDIPAGYREMARVFPDSTVILGEFGQATPGSCAEPSLDERSQAQTVSSAIIQARAARIPYFVHWMFWNNTPPFHDQILGLLYDTHCPKDAFGSALSLTSRLSNPDMEDVADGRPVGWQAGARGRADAFRFTLRGQGSAEDVGATNRKYARVIVQTPPGRAWLRSRAIPVKGGDGLWVNAFVRSTMKDVRVGVTQVRRDRTVVRTQGPAFTPTGFGWNNWLHRVGPWKVCLDPRAVQAMVTVSGVANSTRGDPMAARYYLDVDSVSAATRPRPASCS